MSSANGRFFSDQEWAETLKFWEVDYNEIKRTLELIGRDYSPRSKKRRMLQSAAKGVDAHHKLVMLLLDTVWKVDVALHK